MVQPGRSPRRRTLGMLLGQASAPGRLRRRTKSPISDRDTPGWVNSDPSTSSPKPGNVARSIFPSCSNRSCSIDLNWRPTPSRDFRSRPGPGPGGGKLGQVFGQRPRIAGDDRRARAARHQGGHRAPGGPVAGRAWAWTVPPATGRADAVRRDALGRNLAAVARHRSRSPPTVAVVNRIGVDKTGLTGPYSSTSMDPEQCHKRGTRRRRHAGPPVSPIDPNGRIFTAARNRQLETGLHQGSCPTSTSTGTWSNRPKSEV